MSTILDALKKVERGRESPREQLLHLSDETPGRRRAPALLVATCAVVGFAGGIGLALWRNGSTVDVAVPDLTPPPAIDVPRAPDAGHARVARNDGAPEGMEDEPRAAEEPRVAEIAPAVPAAGVAPAPAQPGAAEPETSAAVPAVVAAAPVTPPESALEPSPFTASRSGLPPAEDGTQAAPVRKPAPRAEAPAVTGAPAPLAPPQAPPDVADEADQGEVLAALPPTAVEPPLAAEGEPPPLPPSIFDTGRSPPGLPKVTLSFLQWSEDPARRFVFISIDGGPTQRLREGDNSGGLTVAQITPTGVRFRHEDKVFVIRPRH